MSAEVTAGEPGWFADPAGRFDSRYWDGARWTEAVMRAGSVDTDPVPVDRSDGEPAQAAPAEPEARRERVPPPRPTDRTTTYSPQEAQASVAQMLAFTEIAVRNSVPGRLDCELELKSKPNWLLVLLLGCLWIIPAVIYWRVKSRPVTHRITLVFVPVAAGTRIAVQAPEPAIAYLNPVLTSLPW